MKLPYLFNNTNKLPLFIAIVFMLFYWLINTLILKEIAATVNVGYSFLSGVKYTLIGQYFSAITPLASGGQPAQVYYMAKDNIPVGKSTSILIIKFIIYQVVVAIYSLLMFFYKAGFIYENIKLSLPFVLIGLIANFIGLIILIVISFNSSLIRKIINFCLDIICKFNLIDDREIITNKIENFLEDYSNCITDIRESKTMTGKVLFLTTLQLTFYFGISYYIIQAMGMGQASFVELLAVQSLLYVAVSFIPTPGAAGASEGGFYLFFNIYFASSTIMYGVLLWRFISYYLGLILGGMLVLYLKFKNKS